MKAPAADVATIRRLTEEIKPILAGYTPEIQGAVLADLLALWLAGHHVPGEIVATHRIRAEILAAHLNYVREIIPVNAKTIGTPS